MPIRQVALHQHELSCRVSTSKGKGRCLIAVRKFAAGDVIFQFVGALLPAYAASANALQIDEDVFLESSEETSYENCLDHSCDPNCAVRITPNQVYLVARRDIGRGEELCFDYCTTEEDLEASACAFSCRCGTTNCMKKVKGFRFLSQEQKLARYDDPSPFLRTKFDTELAAGKCPKPAGATMLQRVL